MAETFTSSVTVASLLRFGATPEAAVRSFLDEFRDRRDQALARINAPQNPPETATLCWGKAPELPDSATRPPFSTSFTTRKPTDAPQPEKNDKTLRIRERLRVVERVKIASETNKEVYIETERVRAWVGDGSDGRRWILECTPDGEKRVVAKGAPVTVS